MRHVVMYVLVAAILIQTAGCASICYPSRLGRSPEQLGGVDILMLLANVLVWEIFFPIGWIVDFSNGCIYRDAPAYRATPPSPPEPAR